MNLIEKITEQLENKIIEEAKELDKKDTTSVKNSLDAIDEYVEDTRDLLNKGKIKGAQHSMKKVKSFVDNAIEDLSKIK